MLTAKTKKVLYVTPFKKKRKLKVSKILTFFSWIFADTSLLYALSVSLSLLLYHMFSGMESKALYHPLGCSLAIKLSGKLMWCTCLFVFLLCHGEAASNLQASGC